MDIITGVLTYFIIWWTTLFTILPLKIEQPKKTPKGGFAGAPVEANMPYKVKLNSIVAAIAWVVIFIVIEVFGLDLQKLILGE